MSTQDATPPLSAPPCSAIGLRWPNRVGTWVRDGAEYEVTQTEDGEFWVKVNDEEFVPGMLAGLADFRERWLAKPNDSAQATPLAEDSQKH